MNEGLLVIIFAWTLLEGDYAESLLLLVRWVCVYHRQLAALLPRRGEV